MTRGWVVVVLAVAACAPPTGPLAKVWTPREFFAKHAETKPLFGGWAPAELLVTEGERLPFTTRTQGPGEGLPVFPGVSESRAIAYVITDVWENHPDPWLQPVYSLSSPEAPTTRRAGLRNVFPVGLDSTFYSPWWLMEFVPVSEAEAGQVTSAEAVLEHGGLTRGAMVMCPFTGRDTVNVAMELGVARHPLTNKVLTGFAQAKGLVDGVEQPYLDFGPGRAPWSGQVLERSDLFVFTRGGAQLPVATVWPAVPEKHGFLQRVEVPVPAGAAFFVPANRADLKAGLDGLAPDVDAALDAFPQYALRLAKNPACFADVATFPAGCDWLDTAAKVALLPGQNRRPVVLSAAVLAEVAP